MVPPRAMTTLPWHLSPPTRRVAIPLTTHSDLGARRPGHQWVEEDKAEKAQKREEPAWEQAEGKEALLRLVSEQGPFHRRRKDSQHNRLRCGGGC
mmetsp:Transcript_72259/g.200443  ORF Transcript_72259/g.200443 Transcript_72259/m.200443 type:complete len:95 (-) Transcript_72259:2122-2406(-)